MAIAPLCIIQARLHSTRLERKMLLPLGGHPVLWWAWEETRKAHFYSHVVIACPVADESALQGAFTREPVTFFPYTGDEADVLGRFHACAHAHRTEPDAEIVRITPDDFPVDLTRERCTLAALDHWHATVTNPFHREHIGHLFPPRIELNTAEDYERLKERYETR